MKQSTANHQTEESNEVNTEDTDDGDIISKNIPCKTYSVANKVDFNIRVTQNRDVKILKLREQLENGTVPNFKMIDGIVFRRNKNNNLQLYVPFEMEENIIRMIHEKICHLRIEKTYQQIIKNYWFEHAKEKSDKFIKNCLRCIMCFRQPESTNEICIRP